MGLTVAVPLIKQVLRIDLEGDGVNEVLVVAEDVPGDLLAEAGDYSIVFMQRWSGGRWRLSVIGESVVIELADGETPFVLSFAVGAVADLNGDADHGDRARLRVLRRCRREVWEYVEDDIGPAGSDLDRVRRLMENPFTDRTTFVGHTEIELTDASADHCNGRIVIAEIHHQPYGVVHGGVYCTLIETLASTGAAIWAMENGMAGRGRGQQSDRLHPGHRVTAC